MWMCVCSEKHCKIRTSHLIPSVLILPLLLPFLPPSFPPSLSQGLKIAVVVNDVAKVNIDSKLVRERTLGGTLAQDTSMADCIELQNGCACCNAADELLQVLRRRQTERQGGREGVREIQADRQCRR